jgi:hypothetical protein
MTIEMRYKVLCTHSDKDILEVGSRALDLILRACGSDDQIQWFYPAFFGLAMFHLTAWHAFADVQQSPVPLPRSSGEEPRLQSLGYVQDGFD